MAKLKAPLMSMGASGKLAGSLVYLSWKGLDTVREYVVPTNPKSDKQVVQRGYLKDVVDAIHAAEARDTHPMLAIDKIAEALLGATFPTPRTWFNVIAKRHLDQAVADKDGVIYRGATLEPTSGQIYINVWHSPVITGDVDGGDFWYGKTKTSLPNSVEAIISGDRLEATIPSLTNDQKYFIQFRPTGPSGKVGANSGIYTDIPRA